MLYMQFESVCVCCLSLLCSINAMRVLMNFSVHITTVLTVLCHFQAEEITTTTLDSIMFTFIIDVPSPHFIIGDDDVFDMMVVGLLIYSLMMY